MRSGATLQDVNDVAVMSAFWWYYYRLTALMTAVNHPAAGQEAAAAIAHDILHSTPSEAAVKQVVWLVAATTWHAGADPVLADMARMQRQETLGNGYIAAVSNNWRLSGAWCRMARAMLASPTAECQRVALMTLREAFVDQEDEVMAFNLSMLLEHQLLPAVVTCMRARRLLASAEDLAVVSDSLSCLMAVCRFADDDVLQHAQRYGGPALVGEVLDIAGIGHQVGPPAKQCSQAGLPPELITLCLEALAGMGPIAVSAFALWSWKYVRSAGRAAWAWWL